VLLQDIQHVRQSLVALALNSYQLCPSFERAPRCAYRQYAGLDALLSRLMRQRVRAVRRAIFRSERRGWERDEASQLGRNVFKQLLVE